MPAVKLLSKPSVFHDGERLRLPRGKTSALLFYLAYQRKWVSREDLCYLFWPDTIERRAKTNLRQLILTTKKLPLGDTLTVNLSHLSWYVETDVQPFHDAVKQQHWQEAADLYEGSLLEGLNVDGMPEFESWLEMERKQLFSLYCDAVFELCERLAAEGHYTEAAAHFSRLHAFEPLDELFLRQYVHYLHLSDRSDKALQIYQHFADMLQRELGYAPTPATQQLVERIKAGTKQDVVLKQPAYQTNLPEATTVFVGREADISRLVAQLSEPTCRLLTIVAPGGMGKTRLALEVARRLSRRFGDGAIFVPFEAVSSPELMVNAVVEVLGVPLSGQRSVKDEVLKYLKGKRLLLVLDNLEHLLADTSLITDLLVNTPNITLLVTSRERLNLQAEWLFDLEGMQLRGVNQEDVESDAVKLFIQTAKHVRSSFNPDKKNLNSISRLCRQLGGMPLALELAASWLRILSPEEVLDELNKDLGILQSSAGDLAERHLDIRNVFEASWSQLTVNAQAALQQLAVFEGGFMKEAASEVAGVGLPLLLLLVNKAFLQQDSSRRFRPHPLMWQFIREKAARSAPFTSAEEQHASYYARYCQQREWSHRQRAEARQTRLEINLEMPNIRRAWEYATEHLREDFLAQANLALFFHFLMEGRFVEGALFFKEASEVLSSESLAHARILQHHGVMLTHSGHPSTGRPLVERSLSIKRRYSEPWDIAQNLMTLCFTYNALDFSHEEMVVLWRECAELFQQTDDRALLGRAYIHFAEHIVDPVEREQVLRRSLAILRREQSYHELAASLKNLAKHLTYTQGDYEQASRLASEAIGLEQEMGNSLNLSWVLTLKGDTLFHQQKLEAAEPYYQQVVDLGEDAYPDVLISSLNRLAFIAAHQSKLEQAETYFQETLKLNQAYDYPWAHYLDTASYFSIGVEAAEVFAHVEAAVEYLEKAKRDNLEIAWYRIAAFSLYAEMLLEHGREQAAETRLLQALRFAHKWHLRPAILHLLPSFATLHLQRGRFAYAHQLLSFALDDPASMFPTRLRAQQVLQSLLTMDREHKPKQGEVRLEQIIAELVERN